jgi:protease-4
MPSLPGRSAPVLLELDLTQPLVEVEPDDPLGKLRSHGKPRLSKVLRALHEAGSDRNVAGLIAKVGSPLPLAIAEEIRDGVRAFGRSGKPAVAWSETYGESANGSVSYFLATGFGEIWMQPSGEVGLIGVAAEITFLRGTLDKLGIEPQLEKRYEYKNAADRVMGTELTDAHREAMDRLAASAWEVIVDGIAEARGITADDVRVLADTSPLTAETAKQRGLVDRVGYRDEVYADVLRRLPSGTTKLFADRWTPSVRPAKRVTKLAGAVTRRTQPVIALVDGHGTIVTGRNRRSPVDGQQMGSDTVAAHFRAARKDPKVKAVVFRVDSGGGSYVASDTIWREVCVTRDAGLPVVVSMGTMAGSGGYFIACPADVIVAQPGTLTGSIGVFGGKPVITGLLDKVGLTSDSVERGSHSRMFSPRRGFTDDERATLNEWLDAVYDDFTGKVSQGRGMTREAVHEVARGRVWSGADAAGNGLVDTLGGLRDAVRIARERADLPDDAPLRPAVHVPALARLSTPKSSEDPRAASLHAGGWGPWSDLAASLGLAPGGPLLMPAIRLG